MIGPFSSAVQQLFTNPPQRPHGVSCSVRTGPYCMPKDGTIPNIRSAPTRQSGPLSSRAKWAEERYDAGRVARLGHGQRSCHPGRCGRLLADAVRLLNPNPRITIKAPANVQAVVTDDPQLCMLRDSTCWLTTLPRKQRQPRTVLTSFRCRSKILPSTESQSNCATNPPQPPRLANSPN